jgi:hypothetical protein
MTDWEDRERTRLERAMSAVIRQLRNMAERIEREGADNIRAAQLRDRDYATYGRAAGQVVHTASWGLANLNLSNLIDAAADADAARNEPVPAPQIRDVLTMMAEMARSWAEQAVVEDEAMQRRDRKPVDEQEFRLADILRMVDDVARDLGLPGVADTVSKSVTQPVTQRGGKP